MASDPIEERLQGLEAHYEHLPKAWQVGVDQLIAQVRELRQRIAELEEEQAGLREYLALVLECGESPISLAYAHGWRVPFEAYEKGRRLRDKLSLPHNTAQQVEALRAHEPPGRGQEGV